MKTPTELDQITSEQAADLHEAVGFPTPCWWGYCPGHKFIVRGHEMAALKELGCVG